MITLATTKNQVRALLDDAAADRFGDDLLEAAARLALQGIDAQLPNILSLAHTVVTAGRDQSITSMAACLYLMDLFVQRAAEDPPLSGVEYSSTLRTDTLQIHFSGSHIPQTGEILQLTYAARHTLSGLDLAVSTTLPDALAPALDYGTAAHACLIRAASLAEAYAARPGESSRLAERAGVLLDLFKMVLDGIKNFGAPVFPQGFALDSWEGGSL